MSGATAGLAGDARGDLPLTVQVRRRLGRRAQLLAGASVAYNVAEAAVAVTAGAAAGSVALVGFGLDSLVEVSSGLVILWQFAHRLPETRERAAQRAIAVTFFALAAYVTVESVRSLYGSLHGGADAAPSPVGIALAAASLIVMPLLSRAQRRTGRRLGSGSVVADGTQTLLCTYLSAVLLAGLVLNATLGWSWADPLAGLVIAVVAGKEGWENWRGEDCCNPALPSASEPISTDQPIATVSSTTAGSCDGDGDTCCTPAAPARRTTDSTDAATGAATDTTTDTTTDTAELVAAPDRTVRR